MFGRIKDFDQKEVHLEELLAMVANWLWTITEDRGSVTLKVTQFQPKAKDKRKFLLVECLALLQKQKSTKKSIKVDAK